eukprot:186186-Amphidinium_carterae.2
MGRSERAQPSARSRSRRGSRAREQKTTDKPPAHRPRNALDTISVARRQQPLPVRHQHRSPSQKPPPPSKSRSRVHRSPQRDEKREKGAKRYKKLSHSPKRRRSSRRRRDCSHKRRRREVSEENSIHGDADVKSNALSAEKEAAGKADSVVPERRELHDSDVGHRSDKVCAKQDDTSEKVESESVNMSKPARESWRDANRQWSEEWSSWRDWGWKNSDGAWDSWWQDMDTDTTWKGKYVHDRWSRSWEHNSKNEEEAMENSAHGHSEFSSDPARRRDADTEKKSPAGEIESNNACHNAAKESIESTPDKIGKALPKQPKQPMIVPPPSRMAFRPVMPLGKSIPPPSATVAPPPRRPFHSASLRPGPLMALPQVPPVSVRPPVLPGTVPGETRIVVTVPLKLKVNGSRTLADVREHLRQHEVSVEGNFHSKGDPEVLKDSTKIGVLEDQRLLLLPEIQLLPWQLSLVQRPAAPPSANWFYKTRLCKLWQQHGQCFRGPGCLYAHGPSELRKQAARPLGPGSGINRPLSERPPPAPEIVFTVDAEEERRRAERAKRFAPRLASFEREELAKQQQNGADNSAADSGPAGVDPGSDVKEEYETPEGTMSDVPDGEMEAYDEEYINNYLETMQEYFFPSALHEGASA